MMVQMCRRWIGVAALGVCLPLFCLPVLSHAANVQVATGAPFGVARIVIPQRGGTDDIVVSTNGYAIDAPEGRVFYPVVVHRRALAIVGELLLGAQADAVPTNLAVYLLFRGDEPFQVTVYTPTPQTVVIHPTANPRTHERLLREWWQQYTAVARLLEREGDYPPMLETYLTSMLGARLGLRTPLVDRFARQRTSPEQESLRVVLNVESVRMQAMHETLVGRADRTTDLLPVPEAIDWTPSRIPPPPDDVAIEPMASRVPAECFYLRFGSFNNYLWLRKFTEQNGGDVSRLVTLRGHDLLLSQRTQNQLGLKETALAEIFGNQIISDVALIGRDTYLREGAAVGVLFEARNGLLANELDKQRRKAVSEQEGMGATITSVTVGGHEVSFASTPDNRLRSFQVNHEGYHLVTNSLAIVERFLAVPGTSEVLSESADFRQARQDFPVADDVALFAYLSPQFFRGLASPQYQIELRRRLKAVTDVELFRMARLAARHEGHPVESVEDLIQAGFLPPDFSSRVDGSQLVVQGDQVFDSLRGARGSFLPIPDVDLGGVSPRESQQYAALASFFEQKWQDMDPLIAQVRRETLTETGRERLTIDAQMLPFDRKKYGLVTSIVGPATRTHIQRSGTDAIRLEVVLEGGQLRPSVGPHHLFFGVQDKEIPIKFADSDLVRIMQILRTAPAYVGAWPRLGLLELLPLGRSLQPNAVGYTQLLFGLWSLTTPDEFVLVGVDPDLLGNVSTELTVVEAERPAQVRLHIADVSQSKIKTWFAALDFQRGYKTSIGNTKLLHAIHQQLGVAPDQAMVAAEATLGVDLVCALGGEYQLYEDSRGVTYWGSTHWPQLKQDPTDPGQFASPSLAWFRGIDAEVTMTSDRVQAHATMEVEQLTEAKPKLPFFNFFNKQ